MEQTMGWEKKKSQNSRVLPGMRPQSHKNGTWWELWWDMVTAMHWDTVGAMWKPCVGMLLWQGGIMAGR